MFLIYKKQGSPLIPLNWGGKLSDSEVGGVLNYKIFIMSIVQLNNRLPYNFKLKERTRELRKNMTEPEKKIWFWFLRKISNTKFRIYKQRPIQNFIVDFYVPKFKLIIEIDWESHFDNQGIVYDEERTQILEWFWLKVLRFTNKEIMKNFDWVCWNLEKEFWII